MFPCRMFTPNYFKKLINSSHYSILLLQCATRIEDAHGRASPRFHVPEARYN